MKTVKAPFAARAPTWLGRAERRERRPRLLEAVLKQSCDWVRAPEHSPRGPFRIFECRHGGVEIVERGGGVLVNRLRVNTPHTKRESIIITENAPQNGHDFAQQRLGFFEALRVNKGTRVVVGCLEGLWMLLAI